MKSPLLFLCFHNMLRKDKYYLRNSVRSVIMYVNNMLIAMIGEYYD